MTKYVAGWNIPGYLGETDPEEFETREEAAEYLADEIERAADGWAGLEDDETDGPAYTLAIEDAMLAAIEIRDGSDYETIPNAVGSDHDLGVAYWISEA